MAMAGGPARPACPKIPPMATALELRVEPTPRGEVFAEAPTVRAAVAARMAFSSLDGISLPQGETRGEIHGKRHTVYLIYKSWARATSIYKYNIYIY